MPSTIGSGTRVPAPTSKIVIPRLVLWTIHIGPGCTIRFRSCILIRDLCDIRPQDLPSLGRLRVLNRSKYNLLYFSFLLSFSNFSSYNLNMLVFLCLDRIWGRSRWPADPENSRCACPDKTDLTGVHIRDVTKCFPTCCMWHARYLTREWRVSASAIL